MSDELKQAEADVERATRTRDAIAKLPQEVGVRIAWLHNGVIWTRAGDNDWRPETFPEDRTQSSHVASNPWLLLTEDGPKEEAGPRKLKAFDVRSITITMRMCDGSPARTLQANRHSSVKHLLKAMHKLWVIESIEPQGDPE